MEEPSHQTAALPLEDFAAITAALDAGLPRAEVLAEAGLSDDAWTAAQEQWLGKLASQAAAGRLQGNRRYIEALAAQRAHAAEKARAARPKLEGPMPVAPATPLLPLAAVRPDGALPSPAAAPRPGDAPAPAIAPPPLPTPAASPMITPPPVAPPPVAAPKIDLRDRTISVSAESVFGRAALPFAPDAKPTALKPDDRTISVSAESVFGRAALPFAPDAKPVAVAEAPPAAQRKAAGPTGAAKPDPLEQTAPPMAMSPFAAEGVFGRAALPFAPDAKPTAAAEAPPAAQRKATGPAGAPKPDPFAETGPPVAIGPFARPVLPFGAGAPAANLPPEPPRASPTQRGTTLSLDRSPVPQGDTLPFARAAKGVDPPMEARPEPPPAPPRAPSTPPPPPPPPVAAPSRAPSTPPPPPPIAAPPAAAAAARVERISLAQYAQICADVRAFPAHVEQIRGHYALDGEAWAALHTLWYARFDRDPALRARFQALVEQRLARHARGV